MLKNGYNPDVLTCIANLSSDEVFTPPSVVNQMLDTLPTNLWSNEKATFLDPVSKSGVFLREIAKRLIVGLEDKIPDLEARIDHILRKQVFGIGITELTSLISRRSLYCSKYANAQYSLVQFDDEQGNVKYFKTKHIWKAGNCKYCGVSKEVYDRGDELESYSFSFIHSENPEKLLNMKFDVIIGNPPYQMNDGGSGTGISAKPIYHHFVEQAKKLSPNYLCMIIPSRWFAGGKGLNDFRESMLNDSRVSKIYDFMSSKECFPGVNIAGGVNYFLWEKHHKGDCEVVNVSESEKTSLKRKLNEFDVFIRDNYAIKIINKVIRKNSVFMHEIVLPRNPFGFPSKERGLEAPFPDCVKLISSGGVGYVPRKMIKQNQELINRFKVTIGKVVPSNGEVDVSPERGYKVTTLPKILGKNEIHTESYMLLSTFKTKMEAENFRDYMKLKLPRFLLKQTLSSMNISRGSFTFVPKMDFTQSWTDEKLFEYFELNEAEKKLVSKIIRPFDE